MYIKEKNCQNHQDFSLKETLMVNKNNCLNWYKQLNNYLKPKPFNASKFEQFREHCVNRAFLHEPLDKNEAHQIFKKINLLKDLLQYSRDNKSLNKRFTPLTEISTTLEQQMEDFNFDLSSFTLRKNRIETDINYEAF